MDEVEILSGEPRKVEKTYQFKLHDETLRHYKVPKGDIVINDWKVGTEVVDKKSSLKVWLYWDRTGEGNPADWKVIGIAYVSKGVYVKEFEVKNSFRSNGDSRIYTKFKVKGKVKKSREVFVRWNGVLTPR
jgi:hypothetical protein